MGQGQYDLMDLQKSMLRDEIDQLKKENSNLNSATAESKKIANGLMVLIGHVKQYFAMKQSHGHSGTHAENFAQHHILPFLSFPPFVNANQTQPSLPSNNHANLPLQPIHPQNSQASPTTFFYHNNNNFVAPINPLQQSDNYHIATPLSPMSEAIEELLNQPVTRQ